MDLEFALLGPLEVRRAGTVVPLRRGRPRTVLISLLLRTGRTVPAEVLIDQVWGEYLPSNPANALQVHVSYLRRALGLPTGGHVPALRTVAGGYLLDVAPESIDLFRFERLVAPAGRHHPVGGRPAR